MFVKQSINFISRCSVNVEKLIKWEVYICVCRNARAEASEFFNFTFNITINKFVFRLIKRSKERSKARSSTKFDLNSK